MLGRRSGLSGETCRSGEAGRSQSLHITAAASSGGEGRVAKPFRGKGGRKLDARGLEMEQRSPVSASAKQGADATGGEPRELRWAEASVWTDRMVSALVNGVKACPRAGEAGPGGGQVV